MTKFISALLAITMLFLSTGCGEELSSPERAEVTSPTGCLKSEGRYYDPKIKECVRPNSQHEARILDSYRYVNKLAEEGELEEVEYRINFKQYLKVKELESMWSELRAEGTKMSILIGTMPDGSEHGMDYPSTSKVWSGEGLSMGWHKEDPNSKLERGTINDMLLETVDSLKGEIFYEKLHEAVTESDDFRADALVVLAKPMVMRNFWDRHLDKIEAIQPRVTDLDFAQPALAPAQPLVEGK